MNNSLNRILKRSVKMRLQAFSWSVARQAPLFIAVLCACPVKLYGRFRASLDNMLTAVRRAYAVPHYNPYLFFLVGL